MWHLTCFLLFVVFVQVKDILADPSKFVVAAAPAAAASAAPAAAAAKEEKKEESEEEDMGFSLFD